MSLQPHVTLVNYTYSVGSRLEQRQEQVQRPRGRVTCRVGGGQPALDSRSLWALRNCCC